MVSQNYKLQATNVLHHLQFLEPNVWRLNYSHDDYTSKKQKKQIYSSH